MSNPVQYLPEGYQLQEFVIEKILGQGGFGVSYLAYDEYLGVKVVLKEYLPLAVATRIEGSTVIPATENARQDYDWGLKRFQEEAQTLARLRHENIVTVKRVFPANGTAYMVMDYLSGGSLEDRLKQGPLSEAEFKPILDQLIEGLAYVHSQNYMHRDIAPDNIMFNAVGNPVLIDFGAARQQVEGRSRPISAIVKEGYAPLEQYNENSPQGPYTDIYALASVCYEAITGRAPPAPTLRIDADTDPLTPLAGGTGDHGGWSSALLYAVDKGLSVRRNDRPQTLEEWQRYISGEVASPHEETLKNRIQYAWANGIITETERKVLYRAGEGYGFDQAYVDQLITSMKPAGARDDHGPGSNQGSKKSLIPVVVVILLLISVLGVAGTMVWQSKAAADQDFAAYQTALEQNTEAAYQDYLRNYPNGDYAREATTSYDRLVAAREESERDTGAFETAKADGSISAYQTYLNNAQNTRHRTEAAAAIERLNTALAAQEAAEQARDDQDFRQAQSRNTPSAYQDYLNNPDNTRHRAAAAAAIRRIQAENARKYAEPAMIQDARNSKTFAAYQAYVKRYPNGPNAAEAYFWMGYYTYHGKGGAQPNQAAAKQYFRNASDKGHTTAAQYLGFMYHYGYGGTVDYKAAQSYYKLCVQANDQHCFYHLGVMAEKGQGMNRSMLAAAKLYKLAQNGGHPLDAAKKKLIIDQGNQQYQLGYNFYHGQGGKSQNYKNARQYSRNAADLGNINGMNLYGVMLENGQGGAVDAAKANQWYRLAHSKGQNWATYNLAMQLHKGSGTRKNQVEAKKLFTRASNKGVPQAMYMLGLYHDQGLGDTPVNARKAFSWYLKAASAGIKPAMRKVGDYYKTGKGGVAKNANIAQSWYNKANGP